MYEYYRQVASSLSSSECYVNILSFAIAFLKELNSRTIIEYFFNLAYVNMLLERKFINYAVNPNKVFNLHSRGSHPNPAKSAANKLGHLRQQFALYNRNLSVNHSEDVQLTAACEGKMLHPVCQCFGFVGVLHRSHEHE